MAIKQNTVSSNGSFSNLTISDNTTKTGTISWTAPEIPNGATIVSTLLTANLTITMSRGSCTVTINSQSFYSSSSLSFDLGTSLKNSLSVSAKGGNKNARGTVSISNIVYSVTYQYEVLTPIITIVSQTKDKISRITGYDTCEVSFTSDMDLTYWEARATLTDVNPSHGVGLLVESGSLAVGETGYVYVDDEELTNGDGIYTITIYGQTSDGVWSDE